MQLMMGHFLLIFLCSSAFYPIQSGWMVSVIAYKLIHITINRRMDGILQLRLERKRQGRRKVNVIKEIFYITRRLHRKVLAFI